MRIVTTIVAVAAVSACTSTPQLPRSERHAMRLQEAIAGRVAGRPQRCLQSYRADDMTRLDNGTLLFREGRTVWVGRLGAGCAQAGWSSYALVTRSFGGLGLCTGDIVELVDTTSGIFGGACTVEEFVPYRRP